MLNEPIAGAKILLSYLLSLPLRNYVYVKLIYGQIYCLWLLLDSFQETDLLLRKSLDFKAFILKSNSSRLKLIYEIAKDV